MQAQREWIMFLILSKLSSLIVGITQGVGGGGELLFLNAKALL